MNSVNEDTELVSSDLERKFQDPELNFFLEETYRSKYMGPFYDYSEIVIQFGFVVFFSSVVPLIALLAIIENLIRIRLAAWKLCMLCRRPFVELVEDVGMWGNLMKTMSDLGLVVNTALIVFTSNSFESYPMEIRALIFLSAEQILLIYKVSLSYLFPDPSDAIADIVARNEFISDKYQRGIFEDEDDEDVSNDKGHLEDSVDVDKKALYEARKERLTQDSYKFMEGLEDEKRLILRELRGVKEQLLEAYKIETYNEVTGVGETKHGLPLGRLSIKVCYLVNIFSSISKYL